MSDQNQSNEEEWLTTNQVVERYGVLKSKVYRWSADKQVVTKNIDRTLYISSASIDALLRRQMEEKERKEMLLSQPEPAVLQKELASEAYPDRSDELEKLTKLIHEYTYENGKLRGSIEVYEKEVDRLHILIKELVVQQR
jgi:hypothetical protein